MFSKNFITYYFYLLPFFIVFNKSIAFIGLIISCLIFLKITNYKIFRNYVKDHKDVIFIVILFNIYILLNTLFLSTNVSNSIGRCISFIIFSIFIVFFKFLCECKVINFKFNKFLILFLSFYLFIIVDSYFQFFFKIDLLGHKIESFRLTGPFNDEQIIGLFLFKFLFIFIYIINKFKRLEKLKIAIVLPIIILIFLSGERIAAIFSLFFYGIFIVFYYRPVFKFKEKILIFSLMTLLLFQLSKVGFESGLFKKLFYEFDVTTEINYETENILDANTYIFLQRYTRNIIVDLNAQDSSYFKLFKSGIKTWKDKPFFGVGLKNYRNYCKDNNLNLIYECSTHPHNLIFEILSEIGITGLILFILFFFILFKNINKKLPSNSTYIYFSLASSFIPLVNTSFYNSMSLIVLMYQISLIIYLINYE